MENATETTVPVPEKPTPSSAPRKKQKNKAQASKTPKNKAHHSIPKSKTRRSTARPGGKRKGAGRPAGVVSFDQVLRSLKGAETAVAVAMKRVKGFSSRLKRAS